MLPECSFVVFQSLTQEVQACKTDRMEKIHSWLPNRKVICIGNSTQLDPESYFEIYKKYPSWIKAIYIRKVTNTLCMEERNRDACFAEAFDGIPDHVWKVFITLNEVADHLKHVAGEAHMGIVGALQGW
jgi:phosphatidate phosphatase APP1